MEGEINSPQRTRAEYMEFVFLCIGLLMAAAGVVTATAWVFGLGLVIALVAAFCYRKSDQRHLLPR